MRNQFNARNEGGTIQKIDPQVISAANAAMQALETYVTVISSTESETGADVLVMR